jgi:radical SAM protein with 4Fe4S-binding SPASM domain
MPMTDGYVSDESLPDHGLWVKLDSRRAPLEFDLEVTARCNNDCRHCYINLPAGDRQAKEQELTLDEILRIAGEAVDMGALWCLLTGGDPLLRDDIYTGLKRCGLLVSVFTNACLITPEHVELFRHYPPRDVEVTVYGATAETYERVSCRPGSFAAFERGLKFLLDGGIKVRFKAMAIRANVHELAAISAYCRERTKDYFRFDPLLHLRFDGDPVRNELIRAERLSPDEIVAIERADPERFTALEKACDRLLLPDAGEHVCDHLFHCGAGNGSFSVGYDGTFRLCSSLWHPDTTYDLRRGALREAWDEVVPKVRDMRSTSKDFIERCRVCPIINLCLWCPAHAALETGSMDEWVDYFCGVAHARAAALGQAC